MTPKEKAQELLEWGIKYGASKDVAKLFAIKIVDEVINCCEEYDKLPETWVTQINYWQDVKQEIEKL